MPNIPRLAYDLIDMLDETTPPVLPPQTVNQAMAMDAAAVRRGIWYAARRALVDELLAARQEDEDEASDAPSPGGGGLRNLLDTPVLDPSGARHRGVAPVHMAPAGTADDPAGGGGADAGDS